MSEAAKTFGEQLRDWRTRRRLSQLDLAGEAEISTRHLSFIETGRSVPSRGMVLKLAEVIDLPLRERNMLLLAAGYAPAFAERKLDDPSLAAARQAIDLILKGHAPYPALAIDRHWTLIAANDTAMKLMGGVAAHLAQPPVNVLRLSLHPEGLSTRIENLSEWRAHLLDRLRRQIDVTGDPVLIALLAELAAYPHPASARPHADYGGVVVPLRLKAGEDVLSFLSTTTVFGTPVDVTLSELALESLFPADPETARALHALV
ncbi:helix-turn-helix domain-containing protein [Taklimakanibacter deserti]|uniref:helix-turn-helix domain-containing protein n=1 Tax=Taklimakanibacter deserti TaxID=2267839 RepID=UPI000E6515CC